jgi:cation/acetate symporter
MASESADDTSIMAANGGKVVAVIVFGLAGVAALISIAERLGAEPSAVFASALVTIAATIASIGWVARTRHPVEFYVSHGRISPLVSALAGIAAWLAIPAFAGLAGLGFSYGFDALAFTVGPLAGLLLAAVLITPYLAASNAATVPAFLGLRFGAVVRIASALIIAGVLLIVFAGALSALAGVASRWFGLPVAETAGAAAILIAVCVLPGGMNSLTWTGAAVAIALIIVIGGATVAMSVSGFGHPVPPLASAQALQAVTSLEISMIEKGVADAALMKPHAKPFLQIDSANFFGLIFSLMAATAALPALLQRSLTVPSHAAARSSTAWLLGLSLTLFLSASAWALFAKQEVFSMVDRGTVFSALPDWMGQLSGTEGVRIHGVSVALLEDVIAVVRNGASNATQVTDALGDHSGPGAAAWSGLKDPVKAALIEAAKSAPVYDSTGFAWQILRDKVLPIAAAGAGNKTGVVTMSGLRFDADALMLDLPRIMGLPLTASALVVAALLSGMLAMAGAALFGAAAVLSHDLVSLSGNASPSRSQMHGARALMLALGAAGTGLALMPGVDWATITAIALSIAGASLLTVLIAGIWWRRANSFGAILAILSGLAVALVYGAGTRYFPVALYDLWPPASDALPTLTKRFISLKTALATATGQSAVTTSVALDGLAAGTPYKPGIANWWGFGGASALVFAVPVSFVMLVLGSLVGSRPNQTQIEFVQMIRRPKSTETNLFEAR